MNAIRNINYFLKYSTENHIFNLFIKIRRTFYYKKSMFYSVFQEIVFLSNDVHGSQQSFVISVLKISKNKISDFLEMSYRFQFVFNKSFAFWRPLSKMAAFGPNIIARVIHEKSAIEDK